MTVTLYKWTLDRYHDAIDAGLFDDQAVELLRGDIVVMALNSFRIVDSRRLTGCRTALWRQLSLSETSTPKGV